MSNKRMQPYAPPAVRTARKFARQVYAAAKAKPQRRSNPRRSLGPLGFPKQLDVNLRYVTETATKITTGTFGVYGTYQFSVNGLFDPDITGTGHQPLYFDQLMALYNHYTVTGSKITVHLNTAGTDACVVGCYIDDDTTVTPTGPALLEQSTAKGGTMGFTQAVPTKIVKTWSARKNFGGSVLSDPNLQGTASANPTEQQYFTLFAGDQTASNAAAVVVWFTAIIEYHATFQELKNIAAS